MDGMTINLNKFKIAKNEYEKLMTVDGFDWTHIPNLKIL